MRATRWLGVLILCVLMAGCGATTSVSTGGSPTATTPPPTATPTSSPVPTASASQLAACGLHSATGVTRLGDLLLTGPGFTNVATPSRKLPDGTPLAPFHLVRGGTYDSIPQDPAVVPDLLPPGGYWLTVCNSSPTAAHVIQHVSVRIESAAPYHGELDAWNSCDGIYDASTKQPLDSGCGGGFCANETLKATFDTAASGANASVTSVESDKDVAGGCGPVVFGPLPVTLKPHQAIFMNIGIALPSMPATYTFAFGIAQDSAAPTYLPATRPTLLAPVAHKWTGAACMTPAMQAQIPAASSPTYYICPAS